MSLTSDAPARPIRTRFAPSPTGFAHVGVFRTALFSWLLAKKHGGQFILRIEDTDQGRLVPNSLEHLILSLQALGTNYDEGPDRASVALLSGAYGTTDPAILPENGGPYGPYFQSQRLPRYNEVLEQLLDAGFAYYAFETEEELAGARAAAEARKLPYRYSRKYRDYPLAEARERVANGEPAVIRFKMPITGPIRTVDLLRGETIWDAETQDDFVILKGDGFPTYHLAAMVDDHDMNVSHVLRGEEWRPSFPKHVCIYEALGWEQPVWVHVPSVNGPDGKKLSKRNGAKPIIGPVPEYSEGKPTGKMQDGLLDEGYLPEALVNYLALVGWSPKDNTELMSLDELTSRFDLQGVSDAPGIYDQEKLLWMNGVYIRQLSPEELVKRALPFLVKAKLVSDNPTEEERQYFANVVALEQEKYKRLDDVPNLTEFFFCDIPKYNDENIVRKHLRKQPEAMATFLLALADALTNAENWNLETVESVTREVGVRYGLEKGNLTHPVRVAISGREVGPGLFEMMTVLGRERVLARLNHAVELCRA